MGRGDCDSKIMKTELWRCSAIHTMRCCKMSYAAREKLIQAAKSCPVIFKSLFLLWGTAGIRRGDKPFNKWNG